jgi:hypothetical protein
VVFEVGRFDMCDLVSGQKISKKIWFLKLKDLKSVGFGQNFVTQSNF